MDDLIWGGDVRTRDGVEGTLVKVGEHGSLRLSWPHPTSRGNKGEELYAVLLSTGEVRFFIEDALITVV